MEPQIREIIAFATLLVSSCYAELVVPKNNLYKQPRKFEKESSLGKKRFTEREKQLIVDLHNAYRSQVQPPAMNMRELVWDDDIEDYAKDHVSKCTGYHSNRTMVKDWGWQRQTWTFMGENLYYSYSDRYSIEEALYMFWEEGENYDIATHECSRDPCGHYEQMVQATSSRVGCAIQYCENFTESSYPTPATVIDCNYDGLYLGNKKPYKVGPSCSHCNRDILGYSFQFCRNHLCVGPRLKYNDLGYDGNAADAFGSLAVED